MGSEIRQIFTEEEQWWCEFGKDGTMLCSDGNGGDAIEYSYWLRDGADEPETYGEEVEQIELPQGAQLEALRSQLENAHICEETFYCGVCKAYTYEQNYNWSECGHMRYVEHLSSWGGCGYGEQDFTEEYAESFRLLAQTEEAPKILEELQARNLEQVRWAVKNIDGDELEPAISYLQSLDNQTETGVLNAIGWMNAAPQEDQPTSQRDR